MFSRFRKFAVSPAGFGPVLSVCFSTLAPVPAAASPVPPQWAQEYPVGAALPVDTALTYNGRYAAVRSAITTGAYNPQPYPSGITMWDLTTSQPPPMPTGSFVAKGEGVVLAPGGYQPSDLIELTNSRCVAIGSGYSQWAPGQHDQSYIDLFNISGPPLRLASLAVGQDALPIGQNQWAGYAHDVEITRDGAFAIINTDNWIHRLDIGNGALLSINIAEPPWGPSDFTGDPLNLCTPNGAVDSVAVTNDRAVVTTSRRHQGFVRDTWVYLVDIAQWSIVREHHVVPSGEEPCPPHDVAITPNGQMAVVTSDRMVSLFDLTTDLWVGTHHDANASRRYQVQVDSVEVTDTRAVVLSDYSPNPLATPLWQIDVFAITLSPTPALTRLVVPPYTDQNPPLDPTGTPLPTRAHDLAIATTGQTVVRTSYDNVLLGGLVPLPTGPNVLRSPNGSNAHEYMNYSGLAPWTAFSSDSVVTAPLAEPGTHIAATIGARQTSPGSAVWQGYVDFIDVWSGTIAAQRVITSAGGSSAYGALPLDLTLTRDRSEVAVRCADPYADPTPWTGVEADVTFFSMTFPFGLLQGYGGTGYVMGLDSIAAGIKPSNNHKRVISTSEDPVPPDGKVHLVDRP